ncbi:MAG: SIMPL domain-containing protein [bacterium]
MKEKFCAHGKVFKIVTLVIVLFVIMGIGRGLCGHEGYGKNTNQTPNTITVTGKGEQMVKPDIATISMGIEEQAKTVVEANNQAATKMNAALKVLKDAGVADKDVKTTNYNIYPRYDYVKVAPITADIYYPNGKQILAGYTVSESVEVKIRDISKAGDILAKISEIGLNNVSGLTFSVDKEDDIKLEARGVAIDDAKTQAKVLAKQLGVRLVKLVNFSENGNYPIYARMDSMKSYAPTAAGIAPEIAVGENKITSNVTLVYEIK